MNVYSSRNLEWNCDRFNEKILRILRWKRVQVFSLETPDFSIHDLNEKYFEFSLARWKNVFLWFGKNLNYFFCCIKFFQRFETFPTVDLFN